MNRSSNQASFAHQAPLPAACIYDVVPVMVALLSCCDFPTLAILAVVCAELKRLVGEEMQQRIVYPLLPFLPSTDLVGFFDLLHDYGGCVFGHVTQQICAPGSGAGVKPRRPWKCYCSSQEDLNIQVIGIEGLRSCILWLAARGYIYWRGRKVVNERLTDGSDYVVGFTEASLRTGKGITISFGRYGAYLSSLPNPLADKIALISPSRAYCMKAPAFSPNFDFSWTRMITPSSTIYHDEDPPAIHTTICSSVVRHKTTRRCRTPECWEYSPAHFKKLEWFKFTQ